MNASDLIHHRLQAFAESVKAKTGAPVQGQPEEQLRAPFENFVASEATAWNWEVVCVGEAILPDHLGRPDYAVEHLLRNFLEWEPFLPLDRRGREEREACLATAYITGN